MAVDTGPFVGVLLALLVDPGEHAANVIAVAAASAATPAAPRFVRHDAVAVRLPRSSW
jgi:hypothetical protein